MTWAEIIGFVKLLVEIFKEVLTLVSYRLIGLVGTWSSTAKEYIILMMYYIRQIQKQLSNYSLSVKDINTLEQEMVKQFKYLEKKD